MPLLRRKPFVRKKPFLDLRDDEEVFYCEVTNEIFRDYEEFCQRVILCNSLVWSCALTGKPQLTYQEALLSEQAALESIKDFPRKLIVPILYLATLTGRTSFLELSEDVFAFARERYFVGETIDCCFEQDEWCECRILQVVPPEEDEIVDYLMQSSCDESDVPQIIPAVLYQYEVERLENSEDDISVVEIVKASQLKRRKGLYTREKNRLFLKQFVEQDSNRVWRVKSSALQRYKINQFKFDQIFGGEPPEFVMSKKVLKLNQVSPKKDIKAVNNFVRKEKRQESIQKYFRSPGKNELRSPKKNTVPQPKPNPNFSSPRKDGPKKVGRPPGRKNLTPMERYAKTLKGSSPRSPQKQDIAKKLKDKYKHVENLKKQDVTKRLIENHKKNSLKQGKYERLTLEERKQLLKAERKEKALEEKQKRTEEKLKARAKLKEKKMQLAQFMKEWNRQREDLECEDLKQLPVPTQVQCGIPNEYFGDFMMILEFLNTFSDVLYTKDFFPAGVTFEVVERALCIPEIAGPLSDILQLLLTALFNMQEEEDDEIQATDDKTAVGMELDEEADLKSEAVRLATAAASWSQLYQGQPLSKVTLDSVTLTEVLRLHLLASGGRAGEMSSKWRYQQRGGYTSLDDPGLLLRLEEPHIFRALSVMNVCELPLEDKVKIVRCLIDQILTYATIRDVIDERGDKVKQIRAELRANQLAEMKKEREAAALRLKERKEAKLKLKDPAAAAALAIANSQSEGGTEDAEDGEARRQRMDRESSRRKQEMQKKMKELSQAVLGFQLLPLGQDRAHRRFWMFGSMPGLFVEHDERWPGHCLAKPTPYDPKLSETDDTLTYVRKLFEEETGGSGSDKENEVGDETRRIASINTNKKLLAEKNLDAKDTVVSVNRVSRTSSDAGDKSTVEDFEKTVKQALVCTANIETCPVHGQSDTRTKWAFYYKEEDIDKLIKNLNKRGIREGELRQILEQERSNILQNIVSCPVYKLDQTQAQDAVTLPETRKSSRAVNKEDANLNFPPGTPIEEIMEMSLRDLILEMEDKIHMGMLGSLKVYSREVWRGHIASKSFDSQCDKLEWGLENTTKKEKEEPVDDIPDEELGVENRSTTPDSELVYRDPGQMFFNGQQDVEDGQKSSVRNLATAILQVEQSIETKYLQKPLASKGLLKRWETSLMASTSFSQLFLHFSTLDNSIQWSRSALNAQCRLCRRRRDPENMLLCDGCNKGHHLYCLKPKLTKVPQGDWFCPKCRPPEKINRVNSNKKRRLFSQEEEEEESPKEKNNSSPKEKSTETQSESIPVVEVCDTCGEGGHVICCDTCPLLFHIECLVPPLKKIPRGKWYCPKCKAAKDAVREPSKQLLKRLRRCSANAAVAKISVFAKRLQSNSWDDTSSVQSDTDVRDTELQPSRRSSRRSLEVDLDLPLNNAVLQDLLTDVMHHKDAWPFLRPVPRAQVPDYHLIIKRPMDFGKMKYKLNMLEYRNNSEFIADALLIFENCQMYNQVDAQEYKCGQRLSKYFAKRCKELGLQMKEEELQPPEKKMRLS